MKSLVQFIKESRDTKTTLEKFLSGAMVALNLLAKEVNKDTVKQLLDKAPDVYGEIQGKLLGRKDLEDFLLKNLNQEIEVAGNIDGESSYSDSDGSCNYTCKFKNKDILHLTTDKTIKL